MNILNRILAFFDDRAEMHKQIGELVAKNSDLQNRLGTALAIAKKYESDAKEVNQLRSLQEMYIYKLAKYDQCKTAIDGMVALKALLK